MSAGNWLVVVSFLTWREREKAVKNLLMNRGPLSFNNYESISYGMTQLVKNVIDICVKVTLGVGIACVSFENRSVLIKTCGVPVVALGSGPKISMSESWRGVAAGKS